MGQIKIAYYLIGKECSITSVIFLPKIHNLNLIWESIRKTQIEINSIKEFPCNLQKYQTMETKRLTNAFRLKRPKKHYNRFWTIVVCPFVIKDIVGTIGKTSCGLKRKKQQGILHPLHVWMLVMPNFLLWRKIKFLGVTGHQARNLVSHGLRRKGVSFVVWWLFFC